MSRKRERKNCCSFSLNHEWSTAHQLFDPHDSTEVKKQRIDASFFFFRSSTMNKIDWGEWQSLDSTSSVCLDTPSVWNVTLILVEKVKLPTLASNVVRFHVPVRSIAFFWFSIFDIILTTCVCFLSLPSSSYSSSFSLSLSLSLSLFVSISLSLSLSLSLFVTPSPRFRLRTVSVWVILRYPPRNTGLIKLGRRRRRVSTTQARALES